MAAPGLAEDRLALGEALVVQAQGRAALQITVQASIAGGSLNATMQLEPLLGAGAAQPQPPMPLPPRSTALPAGGMPLQVMAHVARRGDVRAALGDWISGPSAPAPIEGLQIVGDLPTGLSFECQVAITGETRWTDWTPTTQFSGTRGRAKALVGVRFRLGGTISKERMIEGEALFLGSSVMRKMGPEIEFRSFAGNDPLIGLRLNLKDAVRRPSQAVAASRNEPNGRAASGRVRIFRSADRVTA